MSDRSIQSTVEVFKIQHLIATPICLIAIPTMVRFRRTPVGVHGGGGGGVGWGGSGSLVIGGGWRWVGDDGAGGRGGG